MMKARDFSDDHRMPTCGFSKILTCFNKVEGGVKTTGLGASLVARSSNRDAYSLGTRFVLRIT